ncbi:hypothetical protein L6452_02926 [Arctium lappa]|uniref:Uncharacterized protein n=1 Tax=Arctium lappa TaxID=4217 RepID=A0ACB9FK93_ARCLA|nr:hypothetical protein L6452_02926 [Arctium lappa]
MISIAENYLGPTALAAWEDWKKHFLEPLAQLVAQGNNIRNFTSVILRIINGGDTGNYYDANICNRIFTKLPGELGREIELKWKQEQSGVDAQWNNATVRAKVIIDHLKAKCSMIQTQRELKKKDT